MAYFLVTLRNSAGTGIGDAFVRLQLPLPTLPGDLNCDGEVNFRDINPFVLAITNPELWQATYPDCNLMNGDINGDDEFNFRDINPFVELLTSF